MPFTFSHPAIVLPLALLPRRMYSITGLVAGSMMPDFEYFLRLRLNSYFSHTWPALFYFNLPLGLLLAYVFHRFVRDALIDNLPAYLQKHLLPYKGQDWSAYLRKHWAVAGSSLLLGAASHIIWDSFTHSEGYFVLMIPSLQQEILLGGVTFPYYRVVQHLSTLLGGMIVLSVIKLQPQYPKEDRYASMGKNTYWLVVLGMALLILLLRFLSGLHYSSYSHIIASLIGGGLWGLIVASVLYQKSLQKAVWP